jgi:hypothetical protein
MTNQTTTLRNDIKARRRVSAALVATAAAVVALIPATADAAKFGAELTPDVQPSNAGEAHPCSDSTGQPGKCTRVSMEAYGRPNGGHLAPKDGVIKKIRIIAGEEGNFRPQIAKAKPNQEKAKVVYTGDKISYDGQTDNNWDTGVYNVESFKVHIPVKEGQYLGMLSRKTSTLRCSSGGANQLLFQPPLVAGGGFEQATADDGCWLLMEAVIK